MTADLTTEILRQIRTDIADLKTELKTDIADVKAEVADVKAEVADVKADVAGLRRQMNRRFQHFSRQFSAAFALMGTLADNDREHDRRLDALESRSTDG